MRLKHAAVAIGISVSIALQAPGADDTSEPADWGLVPAPAKIQCTGAGLSLDKNFILAAEAHDAVAANAAEQVAVMIADVTGTKPPIRKLSGTNVPAHSLLLATRGVPRECREEGYELTVTPEGAILRANTLQGFFYGSQTLRQLLTCETNPSNSLRGVHIVDTPRYTWRGMHLDVGRHFMPLAFVKRYIDLLAMHKFNIFHWHLTEDQGWRIEIKKYPKLTEVAAWRNKDGHRYGGFYTQDEIREIVAYAQERHITIVPEIEMPGHALAAIAAYPEFSCTGGPFEVTNTWGVHKDVYCAGNDETFVFLENVLTEVAGLFPGPFLHIGGDECPKDRWKACAKCQSRIKSESLADEDELQSYFIKRIAKILAKFDKRLVGWDEILEGGLAPSATVMSWRGTKGGIRAAGMGHDVIMCPTSHCYFDYRQSDATEEHGASWAPHTTLEKVYSFEPTPNELGQKEAEHVLGAQGNCWTERMPTTAWVEYMVYPRACALSEVVWSPKQQRDWGDFRERLRVHLKRLDALNVNYRPLDK